MMYKYIFFSTTGYVGMDSVEALAVDDNITEQELVSTAHDIALANAETYGIYPDTEEEEDEYSGENIEGWYELYDPEKHDMLRSGGGSFELDFEWQMGDRYVKTN